MGLQRGLDGLDRGARAQQFGHVGVGAGIAARIEGRGGLNHHQPRGLKFGLGLGQAMLQGLVAADGYAEGFALVGVGHGLFQRVVAQAHGHGGHQQAFRVQGLEHAGQALSRLADQAVRFKFDLIEKHQVLTLRPADVDIQGLQFHAGRVGIHHEQ